MKQMITAMASLIAAFGVAWAGPTASVIYTFPPLLYGIGISGSLAADPQGNIYGVLPYSGPDATSQVFKLAKPAAPGGAWQESIVYTADGTFGAPLSSVYWDATGTGSLIVSLNAGGPGGGGSISRLTPTQSGAWTPSLLYAFQGGLDGATPQGPVISDASGGFFGVTFFGGASNQGSVFELTPQALGGFAKTTLYSFKGGKDGASPDQPLLLDQDGRLFGLTSQGGSTGCVKYGCGTAFVLQRRSGSAIYSESVIYRFLISDYGDESGISGPLIFGPNHKLLGTFATIQPTAESSVYALVPSGPAPVTWAMKPIYSFLPLEPSNYDVIKHHGTEPSGGVAMTADGNLIGLVPYGGDGGASGAGDGGFYQFTPSSAEAPRSETVFYSFTQASPSVNTFTNILVTSSGIIYQAFNNQVFQVTPN